MLTFFAGIGFGLLFGFLTGIFVFKNNQAKAERLANLAQSEAEKVADKVSDRLKK